MNLAGLKAIFSTEELTAFLTEFGGQKFWIPVLNRSSGRAPNQALIDSLVRTIGAETADRLRAKYGGEYMHVPKLSCFNIEDQRKRVAELHRQQMRINDIVKITGIGRRTIFRYLNEKITSRRSDGD